MKYRQLIDFHRRKIAFKKKRYLKKKLPGLYMCPYCQLLGA